MIALFLALIAILLGVITIALVYGRESAATLIFKAIKIGKIIGVVLLGMAVVGIAWVLLSSIQHEQWKKLGETAMAIAILIPFGVLIVFTEKFLIKTFPRIGSNWRMLIVVFVGIIATIPVALALTFLGMR